jgi:hypothetical protein
MNAALFVFCVRIGMLMRLYIALLQENARTAERYTNMDTIVILICRIQML